MVTSVWAISEDRPVMITPAPISRDASTVCTRWLATGSSTSGTPVMSMTTTLARWVRIAAQQLVGQLLRPLGVEDADDRQDEQPFADLQHGGRELPQGVLLLADDPFALLDEADRDGVGDAVRGRLVGVEYPVEQVEVVAVLLEQGPGQHVAQQQDDADDLVGLDAPRDDPLGQVAGVVLQRLDAAGLQHLDVVVVDRRRLREHLLGRHRREQVRVGDAARPTAGAVGSGSPAGVRPARAAARRLVAPTARASSVTVCWSPSSSLLLCVSQVCRSCRLAPFRHGDRGARRPRTTMSNSSINRRAPGRPSPSPPYVLYPSCSACSTSGMPGPTVARDDRSAPLRPSLGRRSR